MLTPKLFRDTPAKLGAIIAVAIAFTLVLGVAAVCGSYYLALHSISVNNAQNCQALAGLVGTSVKANAHTVHAVTANKSFGVQFVKGLQQYYVKRCG
jgi:uncharacterized membrane protein